MLSTLFSDKYKNEAPQLLIAKTNRGRASMKIYQPTLINFRSFKQIFDYAKQLDVKIIISKDGVLHTERIHCPHCGGLCSYNGSNKTGNIISRSVGSFIKKGQQYCKTCDKTIQVENEFIDTLINELNQFIQSNVLSLREKFMSYPEIAMHLNEVYNIQISVTTLETICERIIRTYDSVDIDFEIKNEFYGYDEQYIKVNGKLVYRVIIFDYKNNCPIYEAKHETLTKNELKNILRTVFGDNKPKGFVFDMRPMYPNAFKEVFGKTIKLQFCVFHLNKLILDEYRQSLKIGKKVKWSIASYLGLYSLFDIFYVRKQELDLLKKFQKDLNYFKKGIKIIENIDTEFKEIKFPKKCKNRNDKNKYLEHLYEKELIKTFRKHLHAEKLRRKRDNEKLKPQTKEDARKKLDKIYTMTSIFYPKKIQKRIGIIKTNFELFTGSDGEYLTNNKLEGFFGTTLKKFRKKGFHSDKGLQNFFNFRKLRQSKTNIIKPFSITKMATLFGIITFLPEI